MNHQENHIRLMGKQVIYRLTEEERKVNNYQDFAPAIIVAAWENEYQQNGENPEFHWGLNLKIITDGENNLWKTSVKRSLNGEGEKGNPLKIEQGTFFYGDALSSDYNVNI
ncbi:MAG TPA: hypothetical protein VN026_18230 [Bacteroidia bacterium]|jgi:hypothetical protein|nr:hypothetical protein [Bacteroidia bacterium]